MLINLKLLHFIFLKLESYHQRVRMHWWRSGLEGQITASEAAADIKDIITSHKFFRLIFYSTCPRLRSKMLIKT